MHHFYFPSCPVDGPIEPPVPFGHMLSKGAIPKKCSECEHSFEGSCTRYIKEVGHFLHLDHGPCGIDGPTDPVIYENDFVTSKVEVPRKCAKCYRLAVCSVKGLHCTKDADKWGDFHHGLDWGTWQPERVYLRMELPKVTTKVLVDHAYTGDLAAFIEEHQRTNPGITVEDAKSDFNWFRNIIEGGRQKRERDEP